MSIKNIDIYEALKESYILSDQPIEEEEKEFSSYSPIYIAPTSNIIDTIKLYDNVESALTVGSSGNFPYELALNGAKKIDCFDKNILQYLFFELFDASIQNLDYHQLINNFTARMVDARSQDYSLMFGDDIFYDVLPQVKEPAREYWKTLFFHDDIRDFLITNLFRTNHPIYVEYLEKFSSIYQEDKFYKLQDLLKSNEVSINYHICDITEIDKEFKDNKYDLIIFDNILQYYKSIDELSTHDKAHNFIQNRIVPMLNDDGKIQVGYGFQVIAEVLDIMNEKEANEMQQLIRFMKSKIIEKSMQNDFIPNMIKNYDMYDINYIPGVEPNMFFESKNVVLTYKKSNNRSITK